MARRKGPRIPLYPNGLLRTSDNKCKPFGWRRRYGSRRPQVSTRGRFRSAKYGISYTPKLRADGYRFVHVCGKPYKMCRLVAATFDHLLPRSRRRCQGRDMVNHRDSVRGNDDIKNLEWCDAKYNKRYQVEHQPGATCASALSKPVHVKGPGTNGWKVFESRSAAARALRGKVSLGGISKACAKGPRGTKIGKFHIKNAPPGERARLPGERWKKIGETGAAISSLGRFRSTTGVTRTPKPTRNGARDGTMPYLQVGVASSQYLVHRLVAQYFVKKPDDVEDDKLLVVHHRNGKTHDNRASNLQWLSVQEHAQCRNTFGPRTAQPVKARPLDARTRSGAAWQRFPSIAACARCLNVRADTLSDLVEAARIKNFIVEKDLIEPHCLPNEVWADVVVP